MAGAAQGGPRLVAIEPQIFVADLDRACTYYRDRLGFALAFAHGDPPFYAQLVRDGVAINLRHADRPAFDPAFRAHEADALSATILVDDAGALSAEFRARGAIFHQPLRTEAWGSRTFIIRDPDGNLLCFAG